MKITGMIAAVAIAGAATSAYAGNPTAAGTDDDTIVVIPTVEPAGSSAGSLGSLGALGSLGGAAPAIAGLLVVGALAASAGS